jgi:hypothetical protein
MSMRYSYEFLNSKTDPRATAGGTDIDLPVIPDSGGRAE